jgi:HK97 family phage portal protein
MSILARLWPFGRKSVSTLDVWRDIYGLPAVKSGQTVNWTTALQCTTALAACRVISEGIAQLPSRMRRTRADGRGSDVVRDHPLARFIDRGPNDWQTWFEFVETLTFNAVLGKGGFALKVRGIDGRLIELLPLPSMWVTVKRRDDWSVYYEVDLSPGSETGGRRIIVERDAMLHLRGPSVDGYRALEGIRMAREAIGLALATEEAHARLHANGIMPSGVYTVEGTMTKDQHERISAYLEQAHAQANRSRVLILDRAAKWTSTAMTGVDAQHLETRRHQIEEVCRALRVLPIMVGYSDKATTYASAEQMFLAHVVHSLVPWVRRWETTVARDLLTARETEAGLYFDMSVQGLLRGDAKTRADFYQKAVLTGWMTRNEVRALEELNPLDGLDEPLTPSNMMLGAEPPAPSETAA